MNIKTDKTIETCNKMITTIENYFSIAKYESCYPDITIDPNNMIEVAKSYLRLLGQCEMCGCDDAFFHLDLKDNLTFCLPCNDVFGPMADAEDVSDEDFDSVYNIWKEKGSNGLIEWIGLKRGIKPREWRKKNQI